MVAKGEIPWPSVGHMLRARAEELGDRELFRFEGASASFREVEERSNRLANLLRAHGVGRGDRVALMMHNGLEWPTAWLGVAKAGAVTVPANVSYREDDLAHVLTDSGACLALVAEEFGPLFSRIAGRCPELREILALGHAESEDPRATGIASELESAPSGFALDGPRPGDLMNLQFTSGTTGVPKACMQTHEFWLEFAGLVCDCAALTPDDVVLTAQPFSYLDPQWAAVACIRAGIPLLILPRFSASTFWKSVAENGITFFSTVGTIPVFLMKQPPSPYEKNHRLRLVACAGLPAQLHAAVEARWGVPWREAFGMTETGIDLMVPIEDADSVGSGAMGRPVGTKRARVVDEEGREVPDGAPGELVIRGRPLMSGYWNRPEANAEVFRDGWFHTGDLARRDQRGYFYMVGRKKDMVRRSGENIAAAEVENVVNEHPSVRASAVVPIPDELRGEEVKAFVLLLPGIEATAATARAIVEFASRKLARFKLPRFVEFVEELPLTPSERIAKHELLARSEDPRAGAHDVSPPTQGGSQ